MQVAHFLLRSQWFLLCAHGWGVGQIAPAFGPTHLHLPAGEQAEKHQQRRLLRRQLEIDKILVLLRFLNVVALANVEDMW